MELQVSKVSPEYVVQSAFKSFFRRLNEYRFDNGNNDDNWGLLSIITIRKCNKWGAFYRCEKRAVWREISDTLGFTRHGKVELASTDPGPEDVLVVEELLGKLLNAFEPRQQQMILLRIDGCSIEEIARSAEVVAEPSLERWQPPSSCFPSFSSMTNEDHFMASI